MYILYIGLKVKYKHGIQLIGLAFNKTFLHLSSCIEVKYLHSNGRIEYGMDEIFKYPA